MLFNGPETCIANAGYTSPYFYPSNGVRQGCCVSPLLFIIAVELMAIMIRNNERIQGITINNKEYKISQFADDTTCFVQSVESAMAVMNTLSLFERFSGLHINTDKSVALPIGTVTKYPSLVGGIRTESKAKILGVWFSNSRSSDDHYNWNFLPMLQKMRGTCKAWCNRTLSLKGKVTVYNTLVLSLLQYITSNTQTPPRVLAEVKALACDFIWAGKRSKIAFNTLIQETQEGGLKLFDLESRVKASLLAWAKRIILSPEGSAGNLIRTFCGELNPALIWATKRCFSDTLSRVSPFYSQVLKAWQESHNTPPNGEGEIRRETIWNNPRIPSLSENRSRLRWSGWIEAGILTIGHLCHSKESRLMGQKELEEAFPINPTFLEALAIRNYVPIQWKRALTRDFKGETNVSYNLVINDTKFDLMNSGPKAWFKAVVATKRQVIKRQQSWTTELSRPGANVQIDWNAIYCLPFKITHETKLQSFHYRIAHRLITCNKYRLNIKMHADGKCAVCGKLDTLVHFFAECPAVREFWNNLSGWCESLLGFTLAHINEMEKVLGLTNNNGNKRQFKLVNWILLNAKFYIHRCRLFQNGKLSLLAFLAEAKNKLRTEEQACYWEGRPKKFNVFEQMFKATNP